MNIVSFDVPYPADYGGVIDVFHKLRVLKLKGIKIILHCFKYGREESPELNDYCEKVYYYKRNTSFLMNFHYLPYIVYSRISQDLIKNLDSNNYPILFEGLHTCGNIIYLKKKNRKIIYRESNIEHQYYKYLSKNEKNIIKRLFFNLESIKLFYFQKIIKKFDFTAVVSSEDEQYLKKKFPKCNIELIPSFHEFDNIKSKNGKGKYILFHGNLSISENSKSVNYLIDFVFSKIEYNVIIAGKNPSKQLIEKCKKYKNISLIINPNSDNMNDLIQDSQIICLHSFQKSGLKLKLLYSLFNGRFTLVNSSIIYGTSLEKCCILCENQFDYISKINEIFEKNFDENYISEREIELKNYDNNVNSFKLINSIFKNN